MFSCQYIQIITSKSPYCTYVVFGFWESQISYEKSLITPTLSYTVKLRIDKKFGSFETIIGKGR